MFEGFADSFKGVLVEEQSLWMRYVSREFVTRQRATAALFRKRRPVCGSSDDGVDWGHDELEHGNDDMPLCLTMTMRCGRWSVVGNLR